ncbi:Utp14-domain-containing protein [Trametes versicolor FP-101664 SS1]|uniref:Utp14-domain-containing protein n=1 Tax=Trametes versicolor (strain FP-101664) TaxID=717944 RepID=UPI0004622B9F|nr:Utp14-domain-containing protein [Trametes versicolor FP-101664 SS1]EIW64453.1 Utp14-domain-containing protein [Trametes versicolor FP-101664 SS1]
MARGRNLGKSARPAPSSRKTANALGYAKRHTLKSKALSAGDLGDVYEYQQDKVRRSKVKLELERDEAGGARSGSEEDEDGPATKGRDARPRLVGENDDDDAIGEDEDEEIDSDEAFEESDNERYAGFSFTEKKKAGTKSKSKKRADAGRAVRFAEVDLNEDSDEVQSEAEIEDASEASDGDDDDEEEEGDPSEFIDVLDVLDGRGDPESEDEHQDAKKTSSLKTDAAQMSEDEEEDEEMNSEEDSEEDEDEDDKMGSASEPEDEEDDSALQDLEQFVSGLDAGQKRKAPDEDDGKDVDPKPAARKRRLLPERTELGAENEFAPALSGGKLNLDDLLAPLEGQSSNLASLKKSAKVLASTSGKVRTLSAPLPQRTAEKLDREAAYEQTKEEVDKWKATMQRIKEAEHLSFPLQAEPKSRTSNLELAAKFKPTTELESAVDKLLKSAKMREDEIAQTETLKMNHLSVEEVAARRAELAKMRELMFRAEAKAKRVAKIKSKTYRRLKKKERARLAEKLGEGSDDDLDDEEARLKREVDRARERATLRHKNTGKWAKAMRERGELDEDQRRDINEMLDRGERLRKKIRGEGDSGDEDSDDDASDEEGEDGAARIKSRAFDELAALDVDDTETPAGKSKSIFEMKFMRDAMAREQRRADEIADDFVKEMGGGDPDADDDADAEDGDQPSGAIIQRVGGRVVYRPGALNTGVRPVGSLASDTSSVTLKSTDLPPEARDSPPDNSPPGSPVSQRRVPPPTDEVNPWIAQVSSKGGLTKHEVAISKESAAAEKSKNKLRKRVKNRLEEKAKALEDAAVDVSLSTVMTLANGNEAGPSKAGQPSKPKSKPTAKSASVAKGKARASQADDDSDSDANSEVEEQESALTQKGKGKVKAFEQRDLVALAFAGDNVVQDFADAKRREIQEDAPKEIDTTLPGWGTWGGTGTKKAPPKPHFIKKIAGVDPTTRADYKKTHVVISEKRDKKAAKYQVKDLPFPYTSKAQFDRSMEVPLGTEWNTRLGFQRATLPKVVTKMGKLITPLEKHA